MASNLIWVEVNFADPQYNYKTDVNGQCSDESITGYFVGERFDRGAYPTEDMQNCTGIVIHRE